MGPRRHRPQRARSARPAGVAPGDEAPGHPGDRHPPRPRAARGSTTATGSCSSTWTRRGPACATPSASRRVIADLHEVVRPRRRWPPATGSAPAGSPTTTATCWSARTVATTRAARRSAARSCAALRESRWADEVWECSHIGGDRFAGNLVLLPDSLYFGTSTSHGAERVLAAHDAGRLDLANFRGRSTLRLAEQAAEHFVRAERGPRRARRRAARSSRSTTAATGSPSTTGDDGRLPRDARADRRRRRRRR